MPFKPRARHGLPGLRRIVATGLFTVIGMLVLTIGLDWLAHEQHIARKSMWIVDAVLSVLVGLLVAKMIRDARCEKQRILYRLLMIAEMNHNIRNSLEVIQLSAHVSQDKEAIEEIDAAVNRIHWALKEFVPVEPMLSSVAGASPAATAGAQDSCIVARRQGKSS